MKYGFSREFPRLLPEHCVGNFSRATTNYNCFAWAALVDTERWEPDPFLQYYWPDSVPREYTVDAFLLAFGSLGYQVCNDGNLETGVEKIALYCLYGLPTHAARQLENGNWTTKFGNLEDVEHSDLDCLTGPGYGDVQVYMKRRRDVQH
jgi:hypothetical protein